MSYGIKNFFLFILSILKYFPYMLAILFLPKVKKFKNTNSILLIKADEIGDYILFRNYLKVLRTSENFINKKIVLCGNIAWKNIFDNFDSEYVDETIWLNKSKFFTNIFFRRRFLNQLAQRQFDYVVNCSYSRNFYLDDTIAKASNSLLKIGFKTDLATQFSWQRKISTKYYSNLVEAEQTRFEFYKNRLLFEYLIDSKIKISKPFIEKEKINSSISIPSKSAAFFIGAKQKYRRWDIENFITVAKYLLEKYQLKIFLLGAAEDAILTRELISGMRKDEVVDLAMKTSLVDTFKVLKDVDLFLTNDSGLAHIAVALGCKSIVLSNGSRFGRFFPYPPEISKKVKALFPNKLEKYLEDETYLQLKYKYTSDININEIEVNKVVAEVDTLLRM
jgi:ADP-heptose:LPS heptosyltransferase